jgi:plastocyanin
MRISVSSESLACAAVALGLLFTSTAPRLAAAPRQPVRHTVTIDGTRFQPDDLAVRPGESVTWINRDPFPHTVTATAGGFDSKEIQPGKSWTFKSSKKGELTYACTLHPTMKGTLRVK